MVSIVPSQSSESREMKDPRDKKKPREIPNNIEAEQALLGAILVNNAAFSRVSDFLKPAHFHEPLHQKIYEVISSLIVQNRSANPVTVKGFLNDGKVGDLTLSQYLAALTSAAVTIINARDYAEAIHDLFLRRELIDIGEQMVNTAFDAGLDEPPKKMVEEASTRLYKISELSNTLNGSTAFRGSQITTAYTDLIGTDRTRRPQRGVPIALDELAAVLCEKTFEVGNIYGILASSGEGKTSLMLQLVWGALLMGHPVGIFSYDQSPAQIVMQIVAQQTGIEVRNQKSGDMTDRQIDEAIAVSARLSQMPFEIFKCKSDKDGTESLAMKARNFMKHHANGKPPLMVFDHAGAIPPHWEDKRSDEGSKARNTGQRMKDIMGDTGAAGLILQQRSGTGMARFNPRPIASDLFGGEAARQPFDAIAYIFRPWEHMRRQIDTAKDEANKKTIEERFKGMLPNSFQGENTAEIGTIKVRFGKAGIKRYVKFIGERTKYESFIDAIDLEQANMGFK
jgi:replicative DNA helicase